MNTPDNQPTFCVIITTYDDARKIEENLPVFLEQEYEPGYQVIIVDMSSTDDTADVLKSLKADSLCRHQHATPLRPVDSRTG